MPTFDRPEALIASSTGAGTPVLDYAAVDDVVAGFMRAFEIPGAGVAIVADGQPILVKGYGVRRLGDAAPVGPRTQFAIASNTKAFLAACLALLVDEGRLGWDDPVVERLPEFRMSSPSITTMMTVRDLLVHRSGLPLGAGDLMQFPRSDHTAADVLRALPFLEPARGFRSGYAYDNCLYIVAGLLLQRVSGSSWDEFVRERIFAPLGMVDAVSSPALALGPDHAGRHARLGPPARGMGKLEVVVPDETPGIGPAGGISVSLAGIARWLQVQLARGEMPQGGRLWSEAQSAEMWRPQTLISSGPGPTAEHPDQSVLQAYALGWGVADYRGARMLGHAGGLMGQVTRTALLPDHGMGLAVFTNSQEDEAVSGLRYALLDILLGAPPFDWLADARARKEKAQAETVRLVGSGDFTPPPGGPSLPLQGYAGRYRDPWYGDVVVELKGERLAIDFTRTPVFKSLLEPFGPDAFRTRFPRGAGEDAVVTFRIEGASTNAITMRALSPIADFSFDFHHLALTRIA